MTAEEIIAFRKEFSRISFLRGEIKTQGAYITKLEGWNRNDSHKAAIDRAIAELDKCSKEQKELLKGKKYDDWRNFSKHISYLNGKIKSVRNEESKKKWQKQLDDLKWDG